MKNANQMLVVVSSCALLLNAPIAPAQNWPQWLGENRDGRAAFTPPQTWPKELAQKWKVTVGDGVATPALVGEKLYVFARQEGGEIIRCLDAATGKELWKDKYDVLDSIAIASLGEVKSVLLAHRKPLAEAKEIFCDTASLTSVQLLRVLLAEQGIKPEFKPLVSYDFATLPDFALLIGDPALDFLRSSPTCEIWDLGEAWHDLTKLPFVYAVWALKRGINNYVLRRKLCDALRIAIPRPRRSMSAVRRPSPCAISRHDLASCLAVNR